MITYKYRVRPRPIFLFTITTDLLHFGQSFGKEFLLFGDWIS